MCTTLGVPEGVKIVVMIAEVTEDVGCSVHVWGKVGREGLGGGGRFMYIHCTSCQLGTIQIICAIFVCVQIE